MNIILLSGGSGKRLWPLSNDIRSKQFIKIFKKEDGTYESMVQRVYRQIKKVDTDATVTIATGKTQVSAIHNQLGEDVGISVEPCRRDTFPAIALATAYLVDVMHVAPSESVVVCPVDPYVEDGYFEALKELSEQADKADSYVFGFEESYGYLTGSYVRDKDGVDGTYMICEMFSYYATQGISLLDRLDELYKTYGYCLNTLHSYEFDGSAGFARMQSIMQAFRGGIKEFGGKKVVRLLDYVQGLDGLPKSDVLKFLLEDNCSLVVRPSGTEPKLKIYISVSAENKEMAEEVEDEIAKTAEKWIC